MFHKTISITIFNNFFLETYLLKEDKSNRIATEFLEVNVNSCIHNYQHRSWSSKQRGIRQERSNVFRHRRSGWIVHSWRPIESSRTRVERHGNSTQTASMIVCRAITQAVVLGLGLVQVYAGIPRGAVRLAHYSSLTRASRPCSWTSRWQTRDLAYSRNLLWHPGNSSSMQGNWSIYNGPELYRRNVDSRLLHILNERK